MDLDVIRRVADTAATEVRDKEDVEAGQKYAIAYQLGFHKMEALAISCNAQVSYEELLRMGQALVLQAAQRAEIQRLSRKCAAFLKLEEGEDIDEALARAAESGGGDPAAPPPPPPPPTPSAFGKRLRAHEREREGGALSLEETSKQLRRVALP